MSNSQIASAATDTANRNLDLTRAFFKAWERKDVDAIVAAFAPDGVYHNIPFKPVQGHEPIRKAVEKFVAAGDDMTFELRKVVCAGDAVVTERVDGWTHKGERRALPVMGILEFDPQGRLASWREYFDVKTFQEASA
ncbi:MAG TPA: limonene-1,2-epoxide hydrolase family protein [Porticoccaceae bacterium]|nr:limonene-1,2-epoxide hydrolase family protein [Porticoccaceae bacterium]